MNNPSIPESEIVYHRWGWSRHLYVGEQVSVAVAYGRAGSASSLHCHRQKANSFLVIDGTIELQDENGERTAYLIAGQSFTVPARVKHRMVFVTDAVVHEVYQADAHCVVDVDDIDRRDEDLGWEPGGGPSRRLG